MRKQRYRVAAIRLALVSLLCAALCRFGFGVVSGNLLVVPNAITGSASRLVDEKLEGRHSNSRNSDHWVQLHAPDAQDSMHFILWKLRIVSHPPLSHVEHLIRNTVEIETSGTTNETKIREYAGR